MRSPPNATGKPRRSHDGADPLRRARLPREKHFTPSGQRRSFGAKSLSAYATEEKINGQGSTEKQPREEETETDEGKTGGRHIAVFRPAAEAHGRFFIGQETIAPRGLESDFSPSRLTAAKYLEQLTAAGLLEKQVSGRNNYYVNKALVELFLQVSGGR